LRDGLRTVKPSVRGHVRLEEPQQRVWLEATAPVVLREHRRGHVTQGDVDQRVTYAGVEPPVRERSPHVVR
jgi:hypothetical protein